MDQLNRPIGVVVLSVMFLVIPAIGSGQTTTDSSKKTTAPAPRPVPSTPERSTYSPAPRNNNANNGTTSTSTSTPRPSVPSNGATGIPNSTSRTYTPSSGSTSSGRPVPGSIGATTYTPHSYTPRASMTTGTSTGTGTSSPAVRSENGVTTYTPRASTSTPASAATGNSIPYSPRPANNGAAYPAPAGVFLGNGLPPGSDKNGSVARPLYKFSNTVVAAKSPSGASTLTPTGSREVVQQLNSSRNSLTGINKRPIPPGKVTVESNGHVSVVASNGRGFDLRPDGRLVEFRRPGEVATFRDNGHLAHLHTATMDITHGPRGQRMVVTERPDHSRIVGFGAHSGYVRQTLSISGNTYTERKYIIGPFTQTRVYATYSYHGVALDHYVPRYTYAPAFYGWAYYGWDRPSAYAWGWDGQPWLGYYGGYFSPALAYASGAAWLADFYLGQTLSTGYQQQNSGDGEQSADDGVLMSDGSMGQSNDAYSPVDTPITPDVRQAIADEVQQQLAYENAAAAQPTQASTLTDLPQVLTPGHLFVVNEPLNVLTLDQRSCDLSAGNVLQLVAPPADGSAVANLNVMSSRKADCPAGLQVTISLNDLQEMQNNFRAQLDAGLQTMHDKQGQGGLPGAPNSAIAPPPRPAPDLPVDNENVEALLKSQQQQAALVESRVTQSAFSVQP